MAASTATPPPDKPDPELAPPGSETQPPTEQDLLDEALQETFPASDPISPSAAERAEARIAPPATPKPVADR